MERQTHKQPNIKIHRYINTYRKTQTEMIHRQMEKYTTEIKKNRQTQNILSIRTKSNKMMEENWMVAWEEGRETGRKRG